MDLTTISGLACAAGFAAVVALSLSRGRLAHEGGGVVLACAVTAVWGLAMALPGAGAGPVSPILETAQTLAWLGLLKTLLAPSPQGSPRRRAIVFALVATALFVLGYDVYRAGAPLNGLQLLTRVGFAMAGLLAVENLYLNLRARGVWNLTPLCIGLGGLFAYQIFLYTDALLAGRVAPVLAHAHPAVMLLALPFLALALARNRGWRLKVHLSREVVLHSVTLITCGALLLGVGLIGGLLRGRGEWAGIVQVVSLFGSILLLASLIASTETRSRIRYLVTRNFFSGRYDYRREWMSFIDIVSKGEAGEELRRRVVHAVANIVESPAGALWLAVEGSGFFPASSWNMRFPPGTSERAESPFVAGFKGGRWIQEIAKLATAPDWCATGSCWLAVPLRHRERMIGFITLSRPRGPFELGWDSFELLRALGRQVASYISEECATLALQDARLFEDYGKRFAFVGHDLKNLASQLQLIVFNARRHGDDPDFRADVFKTIEASAARMNRLLQQLRASAVSEAEGPRADAAAIIAEVVADAQHAGAEIALALDCGSDAAIESERLRSALTHLVANAVEAAPQGTAVAVRAYPLDGRLAIDVRDEGPGMDAAFIHDELFRPFRSTKSNGYGIGAYQTRELIREAGGELEVVSGVGAGTTMRILIPLAKGGGVPTAA